MRGLFFVLATALVVPGLASSASLTTNLEKGAVESMPMGNSVLVQGLIKKPHARIIEKLNEDVRNLSRFIPNVGNVQLLKTSDGRNLMYLKAHGLNSGTSILAEVLTGLNPIFQNARTFPLTAEGLGFRSNPNLTSKSFANPWAVSLRSEIAALNEEGDYQRSLGGGTVIRLQGPLHELMGLRGLDVAINISLSPYVVSKIGEQANEEADEVESLFGVKAESSMQHMTYLMAEIVFLQVQTEGELGDYRGFRDTHLEAVNFAAKRFVKDLASNFELNL